MRRDILEHDAKTSIHRQHQRSTRLRPKTTQLHATTQPWRITIPKMHHISQLRFAATDILPKKVIAKTSTSFTRCHPK